MDPFVEAEFNMTFYHPTTNVIDFVRRPQHANRTMALGGGAGARGGDACSSAPRFVGG